MLASFSNLPPEEDDWEVLLSSVETIAVTSIEVSRPETDMTNPGKHTQRKRKREGENTVELEAKTYYHAHILSLTTTPFNVLPIFTFSSYLIIFISIRHFHLHWFLRRKANPFAFTSLCQPSIVHAN